MTELEGVIKYQLNHCDKPISCDSDIIEQLNAWRNILLKLDLLGQDPNRYGGLGFGNISHRAGTHNEFLITGTQTGQLRQLNLKNYSLVTHIDLERNTIWSQGLCQPSSEALTHACVYQNQADCQCVIHIHNPEIWRYSQRLGLPHTSADTPYGTPEMAQEVIELIKSRAFANEYLFTMAGHEDGVVAFGTTLEQTVQVLIKYLGRALVLSNKKA